MTTSDDLPTNWGRWGERDQLGTLNFINDETRARAVAEATTGRVVSLAFPVSPVPLAGPIPFGTHPMPAGVTQILNFTGSPARAIADVLIINTHHAGMTHIDALVHIPIDDHVYPGVPVNSAVLFGAVHHGSTAAFASGLTTRGVLLDLAPGDRLAADYEVTGRDFDEAETRQGVRVESGDALVVRGGWRLADHVMKPVPCLTLDAVRWMAEREVSLIASDIGDRPPFPPTGQILALHQVALPRLGMPLIDNANVDPLAEVCTELGRHSFLFVVGTMAIIGATGLPVNPLAIF
jgi:kynurenine formamidase